MEPRARTESHSSASSGAESDGGERIHPALAPLHGFACDFAQRRCGHTDLFHPHYTRTNLRKGDKILRCFPHCCPDHVSRSFCGASLHVDVNWDPRAAAEGTALPEVIVFARFRVDDAPGLGIGGVVTLHEISQSLQSESNPHGEWIAARTVSSTHNNVHSWLIEVNHEARWYYHWESGVAKRHRLKHHVLDVFVLSPSFRRSTNVDANHRPLEVVAVVQSRPFRLISFRRATPKAVQALASTRVAPSVVDKQSKRRADAQPSPSTPSPLKRGRVELPHPQRRPETQFSSSSTASRPSFADLTASVDSLPRPLPRPHLPIRRTAAPPATTASLPEAWTTLRLQRLLASLDSLRIQDAVEHMDTFHRVHTAALARVAGIRLSALSTGVSPVHAVHKLLATAGFNVHSHNHHPPPASELVAILCELLLWLAFDVDLHRAIRSTFTQEASAVFSPSRLRTTVVAFFQWLEQSVDAFLLDRGWRLEDLVEEVTRSTGSVDAGSDPYDAFGAGFRAAVTQLSQSFVQFSSKPPRPAPRWPHHIQSVDGKWYCAMLQGGLGVRAHAPVHATLAPLFTLMRELSGVAIQLDGVDLRIASLLSGADPAAATRLVLDGRNRWMRMLPSGVSTGSIRLAGLTWGDYVGTVSQSTGIELQLFGWQPASTAQPHEWIGVWLRIRLSALGRDALVLEVAASRGGLDLDAAHRMGLLSRDAVLAQLPFWPLSRKQQLVRGWELALSAELRYSRVG